MHYLHNAWYVGRWSHELEAGTPVSVRILGEALVLYRTATGRPFCFH